MVNETRVGLQGEGAMQFIMLLKTTDVHSVWLANGGRKRLNTMRLQLTIYLIMHGTNLASVALGNASIFQLEGFVKPQKIGGKKLLQMSKK